MKSASPVTRRQERRHSRIAWATSLVLHGSVFALALAAGAVTEAAFVDSRVGNIWLDFTSSASMAAPQISGTVDGAVDGTEALEFLAVVGAPLEVDTENLPTLAQVTVESPPARQPQRERPYEATLPALEVLLPAEQPPAAEASTEVAGEAAEPAAPEASGESSAEPSRDQIAEGATDNSESTSTGAEVAGAEDKDGQSGASPRRASEGSLGSLALLPGVNTEVVAEFSNNLPPDYPPEAIDQQLSGTVTLRLHISAQGRVERVEVVRSSGHAVLDRSAVEAVARWRAKPARRLGQPVASTTLLPVQFQLR